MRKDNASESRSGYSLKGDEDFHKNYRTWQSKQDVRSTLDEPVNMRVSRRLPYEKSSDPLKRRPEEPHHQHILQAQAKNSQGDPSSAHNRTSRHGKGVANIIQSTLTGSRGKSGLWRCPSSSNFYPFGETAALFAFNIHNISITSASATDTVLLDGVKSRPIFIFFDSRLLIHRGLFQIWNSG